MSTQWTLHCDTCEVDGPDLRRTPGGVSLIPEDDWGPFLVEHDWHRLSLVHE